MMLRLFDRLQGKETNVSIDLSYEFKMREVDSFTDFSGSKTYKSCYNKEDFEKTFKFIKEELDAMESIMKSPPSNVKIKLNGQLNGNGLAVEFNNLDSYKEFLEENNLITVQKFKLVK